MNSIIEKVFRKFNTLKNTSYYKMADVREMRIFSADQIQVPQDLPQILKEFSKEVIRNNPADLVQFSKDYFEKKHNE